MFTYNKWWSALALALAAPGVSCACACGCGVFDVGTSSMFPSHSGGMVFLEEDFMDQNSNWSGTSRAPGDNNEDKRIRTSFWTAGIQYLFNRSWGAALEIPYWDRRFVTTDAGGGLAGFNHSALGDVRLKAIYTGFSPDLSTGITFGVKLPTGDSSYANFDPDTQIGSGSTDLLLGAYHLGALTQDNQWSWFTHAQWQQPLQHTSSYRPGSEINAVTGIYYHGWSFGNSMRLAPVLQVSASYRRHDGGPFGHPEDSGYTRAFITPGVELNAGKTRVYADVGLPLYTNTSGNQLVATTLFRLNVSFNL